LGQPKKERPEAPPVSQNRNRFSLSAPPKSLNRIGFTPSAPPNVDYYLKADQQHLLEPYFESGRLQALNISRRENRSVEMTDNKPCIVPYGTTEERTLIYSTDLLFLKEHENVIGTGFDFICDKCGSTPLRFGANYFFLVLLS
jgi:hypothetical protein